MEPKPGDKQKGEQDKDGSQQQQQQRQSGEGQQYGEGSYQGTRQYNEGVKEHMQRHDIEREARDAAPRTPAEEREMEQAERVGRSKSRGEGASPDGDAADENEEDRGQTPR